MLKNVAIFDGEDKDDDIDNEMKQGSTIGRIIFEDIKFRGYSKFQFIKKNFVEKISRLWTTHKIFYHTYLAHGDKLCDWFEDASVIPTIARHHIYKDILHPPLERHSRAKKNPTMTKIVLLWLLTKTILNNSYYRWTCSSNHFSTMRFVLKKGGTISYDDVTGPRQHSRNQEKLLRDQRHSYIRIC